MLYINLIGRIALALSIAIFGCMSFAADLVQVATRPQSVNSPDTNRKTWREIS